MAFLFPWQLEQQTALEFVTSENSCLLLLDATFLFKISSASPGGKKLMTVSMEILSNI